MNSISFFCLSISMNFLVLTSFSPAMAGQKRCQGYPNHVSVCIDETGLQYTCVTNLDGAYGVCKGGNNYRKECTFNGDSGVCNDSNGVRTTCQHSKFTSVCENSKGYRSNCRSYDGGLSICTQVSRWGKPIKN
jgi:hypothetical protein